MKRTLAVVADADALSQAWGDLPAPAVAKEMPLVIGIDELMAMNIAAPEMLIEGIVPLRGASLVVGAPKSGKTLFAAQTAIAVATGNHLFDYYRVLQLGPVMLIEQDDPAATASVKEIMRCSPIPVKGIPFYLTPRVPFEFGPEFIDWLGGEIGRLSLRLCVLDSYTSLRGSRSRGGDIVKQEQEDINQLDALSKRTNSGMLILHHNSKGSANLDWSQQGAGTFAMGAASEAQIFIERFSDLNSGAPERLIRFRGRHADELEGVLRFRKETLDYEHVLQGGGAPLYPLIAQLRSTFARNPFTPKSLTHETGVSRATAHRQIARLYSAGVLTKRGYGEYILGL